MAITLSISVALIHLVLKIGLGVLLIAGVFVLCFLCYQLGEQHQLEVLRGKKTKE